LAPSRPLSHEATNELASTTDDAPGRPPYALLSAAEAYNPPRAERADRPDPERASPETGTVGHVVKPPSDEVSRQIATWEVVNLVVDHQEIDEHRGRERTTSVGGHHHAGGLFASAFDRPQGPAVVTDIWADALTTFAWECLVTLAQHLSAEAGKDPRGRALVPAADAAERGRFLVKPMARNGA